MTHCEDASCMIRQHIVHYCMNASVVALSSSFIIQPRTLCESAPMIARQLPTRNHEDAEKHEAWNMKYGIAATICMTEACA